MEVTSVTKKWKLRAAEQQQTFYTIFGDREWDKLEKKHYEFRDNILQKVAFALYARSYANCTNDQKNRIDSMVEKIEKLTGNSESIYIGYTYVSTWDEISDGIVPLVRVKGENDDVTFVEADHTEVYENWTEYLDTNRLVYMDICYPKNGIYKRRSEGRVLVEYGKSCPLRKFYVYHDTQTSKPLEVSLFFPFAESSKLDAIVSDHGSLTYVTIKKSIDFHQHIKDIDSLAFWLKLISPAFGTILKNEPNLFSMGLEMASVLKAIDYYRSFYDTPYSINGHFAVVHLMKMMTMLDKEKLNKQFLNDLSDVLKFMVNASFAEICHVEEIIRILKDDKSRLNNIFNVVSNTSYQRIKEMKFLKGDSCTSHVVGLITKPVPDTPLVSLAKRIVVMLTNIAVIKKKTNCKEFGSLASNVIRPLKKQLHKAFMEETQTLREKLIGMLKGVVGSDEYIDNHLKFYPRDVLKIIFNCVNKVTTELAAPEVAKTLEKQFLKFCFDFAENLPGMSEISDVFLFLTGKFVVKCRAFFIEYEAETAISSGSDFEGIFYSFLATLKKLSMVKELTDDYVEVCKINVPKIIYAPIINYKGMCIKGRLLQEMLNPLVFGAFCHETMRDHLGVTEVPDNDCYNDNHVLLFKKDSKYVISFSLFPTDISSVLLGLGSKPPNVIGITITYTLPSN